MVPIVCTLKQKASQNELRARVDDAADGEVHHREDRVQRQVDDDDQARAHHHETRRNRW